MFGWCLSCLRTEGCELIDEEPPAPEARGARPLFALLAVFCTWGAGLVGIGASLAYRRARGAAGPTGVEWPLMAGGGVILLGGLIAGWNRVRPHLRSLGVGTGRRLRSWGRGPGGLAVVGLLAMAWGIVRPDHRAIPWGPLIGAGLVLLSAALRPRPGGNEPATPL